MFQVVCDATVTSSVMPELIVGQGPFTEQDAIDFGPDYPIFNVEDDAQYDKLSLGGNAWLRTNGVIIVQPEQPADDTEPPAQPLVEDPA